MGIFDGCLLLSDIDETLLTRGCPIPRRNLEAVKRFTEEGGKFALASGRPMSACAEIWKESGSNTCLVCANGAALYDFYGKKYVYSMHLNDSVKAVALNAAGRFPVGLVIDGDDVSYIYKPSEGTAELALRLRSKFEKIAEGELLTVPWSKAVFVTENLEDADRVETYFRSLRLDGVSVIKSDANYIELIPSEADKAVGAVKLKEYLGAKKLFAIGDYENDRNMLRTADVSAVAGGALESLKAEADYICGAADDGAVADFISILERDTKWKTRILSC